MGVETTGGDVGTLVKNEPLIKNTIDGTDRLYINSHHGHTGSFDFNRLSVNADDNPHGNFGAGLGPSAAFVRGPRRRSRSRLSVEADALRHPVRRAHHLWGWGNLWQHSAADGGCRDANGEGPPCRKVLLRGARSARLKASFMLVSCHFIRLLSQHHWGSGGGMGGLIGSDHTCHEDCPWTVSSGCLDWPLTALGKGTSSSPRF